MKPPVFTYHPDPVATGSVVPSDLDCLCCGERPGLLYAGPVYAVEELDGRICPWCIANGKAAERYDASFVDADAIGTQGDGPALPGAVIEEVSRRTPGFSGWQQEQWWSHCGDAGVFIGAAGHRELLVLGEEAIEAVRDSTGLPPGEAWDGFFKALDKEGSPRAYLFRCAHCGALGGYQDCD